MFVLVYTARFPAPYVHTPSVRFVWFRSVFRLVSVDILKCRHRMCELCDFSPELQFAFSSLHTHHTYRLQVCDSILCSCTRDGNTICYVPCASRFTENGIPFQNFVDCLCVSTFAQAKLYREHWTAYINIPIRAHTHTHMHSIIIMLNMVTVSRKNSHNSNWN